MVSVVMAVKNGGELVKQSIESILAQTFSDFEFIVIDDGSDDDTFNIISSYQDPRMRCFTQKNQGVAKTANRGLGLARGKYIARQDHDDLSLPERLAKQVQFLELNPSYGLVGSRAEIWSMDGPTGRYHDHPTESDVLKFELLFNNPFVHTSTMYRKELLGQVGVYDSNPEIVPLDDYEFISRVASVSNVANLEQRLVIYRETADSLTRPKNRDQEDPFPAKLALIAARNIARVNDIDAFDSKAINFGALIHGYRNGFVAKVSYLQTLKLINDARDRIAVFGSGVKLNELARNKSRQLLGICFTGSVPINTFEFAMYKIFFIIKATLKKILVVISRSLQKIKNLYIRVLGKLLRIIDLKR